MVSDISEYREARRHVEQKWGRAKEKQTPLPSSLAYGVMLEVPSIIDQLDVLLKEVDFISVGTNDLFQFFYACDRANPTVSTRYDTLSSSFLRYLRDIRVKCEKANVPVRICGAMAGKPLAALALLAIGYRFLSVSGPSASSLKKMIISLPLRKAENFMTRALENYSPSLRADLLEFAKGHQVVV